MSTPFALERVIHALATMAVVAFLMVLVTAVFFLGFTPEGQQPNLPWLSTFISILAVGVPSLLACHYPRAWAPGAFPSYGQVRGWVVVGIGLLSLPCYMLFASLQYFISQLLVQLHWVKNLPGTGLEPLVAHGFWPTLGLVMAIAILPAWSEELLFRGLVQRATVAYWGPRIGLVGTAFLFAAIHMEPAGFLPRVLMGLWFGFLALRFAGLGMPTWAHALNNCWGVLLANHPDWLLAHPYLALACGLLALALGAAALGQEGRMALRSGLGLQANQGPRRLVSIRPPDES